MGTYLYATPGDFVAAETQFRRENSPVMIAVSVVADDLGGCGPTRTTPPG